MTVRGTSDEDAWLHLSCSGLTAGRQRALLEAFGSPEAILEADSESLRSVAGITATHVRMLRQLRSEFDIDGLREMLRELGVKLVPITSEEYPQLLRECADPPPLLYVRGELRSRDDLAVAMVGTRRCSPYGEQVAERLVGELVRRGFTVVSGLALGIDTIAHRAALDAGGRTIGVMACGIDVNYPAANAKLKHEMVASGAVVTELAPGTPATRDRFPQRNRIISGLSLGTIVVEAPLKSGALITARVAGEQGREVFAVPGNITSPVSRGCHDLIRHGATLVETAEDVVEGLGILLEAVPEREPDAERERKIEDLPADQRRVLDALDHQPRNIDDVIAECELAAPQVSSALMLLEVKGLVRRFPGNQFVRI